MIIDRIGLHSVLLLIINWIEKRSRLRGSVKECSEIEVALKNCCTHEKMKNSSRV